MLFRSNLPIKEMPALLRNKDPDLMYQPLVSLKGVNSKINIGDRVVSLSIARPYIGWDKKKELLSTLIDRLEETSLFDKIERYSLKYVNIIPNAMVDENEEVFPALKVDLKLDGFGISSGGLRIRSEIEIDGITNIVNILSKASYSMRDATIAGTVVDVDAINLNVDSNLDLKGVLSHADALHMIEKKIFFGLLKDETIESMEPIWD